MCGSPPSSTIHVRSSVPGSLCLAQPQLWGLVDGRPKQKRRRIQTSPGKLMNDVSRVGGWPCVHSSPDPAWLGHTPHTWLCPGPQTSVCVTSRTQPGGFQSSEPAHPNLTVARERGRLIPGVPGALGELPSPPLLPARGRGGAGAPAASLCYNNQPPPSGGGANPSQQPGMCPKLASRTQHTPTVVME